MGSWRTARWRRGGATSAEDLAGPGLTAVDGQLTASIANWTITLTRYFFIDYDGGSDSNLGYIDAAAGTTFTAGQLTGVALKTIERFHQICPRFGAGRSAVVLVKNRAAGATYKKVDGATDDFFDFSGFVGYRYLLRRGSTDLTNSTTDRVQAGGIVASAGPNGDSSWTAAASTTSVITANAAQTLPGANTLRGFRVRFDPNTATAALRNVAGFISANTAGAGGTITIGANLPAAPAAGDTFFIEQPGVRIAAFREADLLNCFVTPDALTFRVSSGLVTVGFGITSTAFAAFNGGAVGGATYAFMECVNATNNQVLFSGATLAGAAFFVQRSYFDEAGTSRAVGLGLRSSAGVGIFCAGGLVALRDSALLSATAGITITGGAVFAGSGGSIFVNGARVEALMAPSNSSTSLFGTTSATERRTVVEGGTVRLIGSYTAQSVDGTNTPAAVFTIGGTTTNVTNRGGAYSFDDCVGATGNLGVGIDASNAQGARIYYGRTTVNTVTGAAGDIKLAGTGTPIAGHATFTLTGFVDAAGNAHVGTATLLHGEAALITNKAGGALAVGDVIRTNGTTGECTKGQADTAANSSGVLGVMVTPPANNAVGYFVSTGVAYTRFSGAPTVGAIAYLDQANAGQATSTVPPVAATNQKLRLGIHVRTVSGNDSLLRLQPELFPVVSNGAAP